MNIGFIGLGIMGKPMARNLIKAGHWLTVYDLLPENMAQMVSLGARSSSDAAMVAACSEVVITMLPNSSHVKEAVLGKKGVLEGASPGTVLIDMSSIAPQASQEIEKSCREKGVQMIEAPVSGGEPKAIDGTLAIMVGGSFEVFEKVKPLLLQMGSTATYCGEIGAGSTTKLANQIIVALNIAAVAEAFTLAQKAGVNPRKVFEAIRGGLAGSVVLDAKLPMMLKGSFPPGFKIDLHIKDLSNALDTGYQTGSPLPLCAQVMQMFQALRASGDGQLDHSALVKYYEKLAGVSLAQE